MRVGARGHDFGRCSAEDFPKVIKSAGYETAQLAITKSIIGVNGFEDITEEVLHRIKEGFIKENFQAAVLGSYIDAANFDHEVRLKQVSYFKKSLEQAAVLEIPLVGTETTNFPVDGNNREEAYQILKDSVQRMAETAERVGVNIGIEPVALHTLNTPELARRLLDEVDSERVKIIFDPMNLILPWTAGQQEDIYMNFIELLEDEIAAVHLKDFQVTDNRMLEVGLGRGQMKYEQVFSWLKATKPDIDILREGAVADDCEREIAFIRDHWKHA